MDTIYVVMGQTGEYSDRNEWPVIAYFTEAEAQEHVTKADRRAKEIHATVPHYGRYTLKRNGEMPINEFDPGMEMDYTGTDYYYMKVGIGRFIEAQPA